MELNDQEKVKYKEILCETMKAFIAFCENNGLRYYASGGTCLGAIRHKGIIPWDDDIDVLMPREDYNKFLDLKNSLKGSSFEIVDPSDNGYYLPFAKFVNTNTTIYEVQEHPFIFGIFIDVFPLDDVGDIEIAKNLAKEKNKAWYTYASNLVSFVPSMFFDFILHFKIKEALYYLKNSFLGKFFRVKMYRKFLEVEQVIQKQSGDKWMFYGGVYGVEKELCDKDWFGEGVSVPFETFSIIVPQKYDAYLRHLFNDYMTPPPVEQRLSHHDQYFVDLYRRWSLKEIAALKLGKQKKYKPYKYE